MFKYIALGVFILVGVIAVPRLLKTLDLRLEAQVKASEAAIVEAEAKIVAAEAAKLQERANVRAANTRTLEEKRRALREDSIADGAAFSVPIPNPISLDALLKKIEVNKAITIDEDQLFVFKDEFDWRSHGKREGLNSTSAVKRFKRDLVRMGFTYEERYEISDIIDSFNPGFEYE